MHVHGRGALIVLVLLLCGCAGATRTLPLVSATGATYPSQARDAGVEGYVVVRYDVDEEGRVINTRVVEAEPPGVFDDAALAAVSRWRFEPPRDEDAEPVTGLTSRLDFTLEGGDRYRDH